MTQGNTGDPPVSGVMGWRMSAVRTPAARTSSPFVSFGPFPSPEGRGHSPLDSRKDAVDSCS
ncbi:protein of unknown function [Azospirillum baldaniorum]|uniref:Uncharacterized protein n=1 Tax=Azospirillum baldaniorum TaxID=1064539 RepID=A0A9P1NMW3_9PROT|nr:protein of unknown function [Azospirillum baldaniorum]